MSAYCGLGTRLELGVQRRQDADVALKELQSTAGWGEVQQKVQAGWGSAGGRGAGVQGRLAESPGRAGSCSLGQDLGERRRGCQPGQLSVQREEARCAGGHLQETFLILTFVGSPATTRLSLSQGLLT